MLAFTKCLNVFKSCSKLCKDLIMASYTIFFVKFNKGDINQDWSCKGLWGPYHPSLIAPNRKIPTLYLHPEVVFCSNTPPGGRKIFPFPGNGLANERQPQPRQWKATTFRIPSFFQWLYVMEAPSRFPFLYKIIVLSFVLQTCLCFCHSCMFWTAILCYSWINTFLQVK